VRTRRYPTDMTDREWAIVEHLLPVPACRTRKGGRPETHDRREIIDAIRYIVDNGCKWRALPGDFPPFQTVYGFFARWQARGVVFHLCEHLRRLLRTGEGKVPNAVKVLIDSQSVKGAETVSKKTRGYDAGKKINGRKRHLVTDSDGLPLKVLVTSAAVQDRDGAKELLWRLRLTHPELTLVWADGAYGGELIEWAKTFLNLTVKLSKRPKNAKGFVVVAHRWKIERTLSWATRARRNCRDYERLIQHSEAHFTWALVRVMLRRLAKQYARQAAARELDLAA
jgi:transposase